VVATGPGRDGSVKLVFMPFVHHHQTILHFRPFARGRTHHHFAHQTLIAMADRAARTEAETRSEL
jgi:hypothetical protein